MIENYHDCPKLCELTKSDVPITSNVPIDGHIKMVEENFDYEFDGISKFYPYVLPDCLIDGSIDYQILVICGQSGKGKSTLLKSFPFYNKVLKKFDNSKAIVSNFATPEEAKNKLGAVGLNSLPVWCKPRSVVSVGEGYRADIALNLDNDTVFDEFTSTVDRMVAKSLCVSLSKYIHRNNLKHIVTCSCHKDYIEYLNPDIVIDLDDECVYDCRNADLGKTLLSKSTEQKTQVFGEYLSTITIWVLI